MVANFLHDEKTLPPDEFLERDAPDCGVCGKPMSISKLDTQILDSHIRSKRTYECIYCGKKETIVIEN